MLALKNVKNTVEKELEKDSSSQNVNRIAELVQFSQKTGAKPVFLFISLKIIRENPFVVEFM